jgi:outer membrane beta-barrel protein
MLKKLFLTFLLVNLSASLAWSQEQDKDSTDDDLNIIEVELEKSVSKKQTPTAKDEAPKKEEKENKDIDFQGLGGLAPFKEISVIQKRYMPKTNRFQFFGGLNWVTNNPFFDTYGLTAKLAWFLNESWGIEGNYTNLSTTEAKTTKELKDIQGVATDNLVYPKNYMGVDVMWLPIYGKFSFAKKIIPFDMYFSAGYGTTGTQSSEKPGTLHVGAGQIFAITKGTAFRWDFSWNSFSAKGIEESVNTFNVLYLTVGASFFFPEAKYR